MWEFYKLKTKLTYYIERVTFDDAIHVYSNVIILTCSWIWLSWITFWSGGACMGHSFHDCVYICMRLGPPFSAQTVRFELAWFPEITNILLILCFFAATPYLTSPFHKSEIYDPKDLGKIDAMHRRFLFSAPSQRMVTVDYNLRPKLSNIL